MATMEMRRENLTNPELADLARSLSILAAKASEKPSALKDLSCGFMELSSAARRQGKNKVCRASRALASILDGLDRAPEGDAPFILDTALNFLATLVAPPEWGSNGVDA